MVARVDGFPPVGTACQFKFQKFEFAGIFQRHSYKEDTGGRVYDLVFESPSKALDGVQVIMSDFTGSVFQEDNMLTPAGYKKQYGMIQAAQLLSIEAPAEQRSVRV